MSTLNSAGNLPSDRTTPEQPAYDPAELYGIISADSRRPRHRLRGWLWKWGTGSDWARDWSQRRQQRLVVAFYDRFVKVVRRYGLRRTPAESDQRCESCIVACR